MRGLLNCELTRSISSDSRSDGDGDSDPNLSLFSLVRGYL